MKGYLGFPFLKKKAQKTQTYRYCGVGSVYVNLREDLIYDHQDHISSLSIPPYPLTPSFLFQDKSEFYYNPKTGFTAPQIKTSNKPLGAFAEKQTKKRH